MIKTNTIERLCTTCNKVRRTTNNRTPYICEPCLRSKGRTLILTWKTLIDKSKEDGSPNVIWLQDLLNKEFGENSAIVICPITDPFVVHHGALGSFVRVYCNEGTSVEAVLSFVEQWLPRAEEISTEKRTIEKASAGPARNRMKRWIRQISVSIKAMPIRPK